MKILLNELTKYKISILLILVGTYISTTFELILPLLLANALNVGIIQNYGLDYIKNIATMMLTLISISIVLNIITNYLITKVSTYCSHNIRNDLFSKILTLKNKEFKHFPVSSLITRTNQDTEQVKSFIFAFLSTIFKGPILLISCITVLKTLNSSFFALVLVSVVILLLFLAIVIYKLVPISKEMETSIDTLNKHLNEKISGFKLINHVERIQDLKLFVPHIKDDKISDAFSNIIKMALIQFTQKQCSKHNIPTYEVTITNVWDNELKQWINLTTRLPHYENEPFLLIPKISRISSSHFKVLILKIIVLEAFV